MPTVLVLAALLLLPLAARGEAPSVEMLAGTWRLVSTADAKRVTPGRGECTLRIDADRMLFCQDRCMKAEPVVSIAGRSIRLRDAKLAGNMTGHADSFTVDEGRMLRFAFYPTAAAHGLDHEFNLDKADCGLPRVAAEVCGGLIFINLDPSPSQGLREFLGPVADQLESALVAKATSPK